jgi:DNA polymerase I
MARKAKLALIDAHALIHRAYHALPPMSTKDGTPTQAVYGFTAMLLKMFSTLKPTHVIAAFDVPGPTFRHKKFADYKAQRAEAPSDLVEQFAGARSVLKAFGIPVVDKQGYEADDVIGTLVSRINGDVKKVIVTGDLDALQLVDDATSVFTLKRGITDTVLYDESMIRHQFGFGPEHLIDYKGLRGDPSDNIPGVGGVGDKTAKALVAQYGSIENIFQHLEDLPQRAQARLRGHKKEAKLSKDLATIKRNAPIKFSFQDAVLAGFDTEQVRRTLLKLEFRSLLSRLPAGGTNVQPTLFRSSKKHGGTRRLPEHYHIAADAKDQQVLRDSLSRQRLVAFDTETDYLGARRYPIIGMSFAVRSGRGKQVEAWYVPVTPHTIKAWKIFLENPSVKKTGHNLKYDYEVLLQSGIQLGGLEFDSMIAAYLLNPGGRQYGLDALAASELDHDTIPLTDLIGSGKDQKKVSAAPMVDLACYACEDADVALRLYEKLQPKMKQEGLTRVLDDIELPLIPVLAEMEVTGVAVDSDVLRKLRVKVASRINKLEQKIWQEAGGEFNVSSTQQLRRVLFEQLTLPTVDIGRTQTGYSTASSELAKLHGQHPIVAYIEEYRELTKLQNTYIETLPSLVDEKTGRIYSSFNQTVAATGRLSSQDPNLQNIPVRTKLGQEIRRAFVAARGYQLIKADYSQLELRLAAHMSQDEKLIDVFRAGGDIHVSTAAWVFGVDPADVTNKQRRQAKTLNFGVLYGMGPQSFARESGVSVEEARSFIGRYYDQYARLASFIEETVNYAKEQGYVATLFGRKRYIPEIHSSAPVIRSQAERIAFNFPIQGTEADILKKAMVALHGKIQRDFRQARMVLTVHDELVCEVPIKQTKSFAYEMKKIMEGIITLDVPLVIDVSAGKNWRDMKRVTSNQ